MPEIYPSFIPSGINNFYPVTSISLTVILLFATLNFHMYTYVHYWFPQINANYLNKEITSPLSSKSPKAFNIIYNTFISWVFLKIYFLLLILLVKWYGICLCSSYGLYHIRRLEWAVMFSKLSWLQYIYFLGSVYPHYQRMGSFAISPQFQDQKERFMESLFCYLFRTVLFYVFSQHHVK